MTTYVPGPLSGPAPRRNRRRNPFWRFRRVLFVLAVMAGAGMAVIWSFASQVELTGDDFESLIETSYICTAEVEFECGPDNATNQLALEGEDRVVVPYAEIPEVVIQAVVATEDKSYFEHQGVDPMGLTRAVYQTAKRRVTGEGSVQGGSTITQQYIKLTSGDAADDLSRKSREVVRAIKLEQELADELGSKELAKQQIIERYLNRIYFGRRAYGIAAAARNYFDKDLQELTLPEAAYLAGLIRNPSRADAVDDPEEAARRRSVTLGLMETQEYITADQRVLAEEDPWASLVRVEASVEGLGDVAGSQYGSEYFVSTVRSQLDEIFPQGEYFTQSLRVYTTLDQDLQKLAHQTITGRLDPRNPDMPIGALVSLDDQGRVVAMMAGSDWDNSQVNLVTGQGGTGFQPGSTMKPIILAEFIEQGFSPNSYYEAPFRIELEWNDAPWKVKGGGRSKPPNHRTVYEATRWSSNTVYAQMMLDVGPQQAIDMGQRLGIRSAQEINAAFVLGTNEMPVLDVASVYSTFERDGIRVDPILIDRIEDAEGNVLCWYPTTAGECDGEDVGSGIRQGEQIIEPSVARQVNKALVDVVNNGTGKAARLLQEDETVRPAAGKTGTTQNYRDAWFTGFTCGLTTTVWMGYPGVEGEDPVYMSNDVIAEINVAREEQGLPPRPNMTELFGDEYDDIAGGTIPAELWNDYMMAATANFPPCEIATEDPGSGQQIIGQELLTTLVACAEPDPALVAPAQAESTSTSVPEGGGDEDAMGVTEGVGLLHAEVPTFSLRGPIRSQEDNGENGNNGNNGNNNGNNGGGVIVPTTEPCLPIDLDGNVIDQSTTTMVDPAGPTTVDSGSTSSSDTMDPNASSTTIDPTPSSAQVTTTLPPETQSTTTTTASTEPEQTTDPGDGNGGDAADDG